jgi:hypothetical protein
LKLALSKGPNRVGVALSSSEDGNRSSFRNVVFSIYLELRTMDKVHKPADFECYTPWSEPFEFYEKSDLVVRRRDSNISAPEYFRAVISTPTASVV